MNEFLNCCLWLDNGYDDAVNKVSELSSVFMDVEQHNWGKFLWCSLSHHFNIENGVAFVRLTLQIYINYEHKSIILSFYLSMQIKKLYSLFFWHHWHASSYSSSHFYRSSLSHPILCMRSFFLLFNMLFSYVIFSERNHHKKKIAKNGFCSSFWFHFDDDGQERKKIYEETV